MASQPSYKYKVQRELELFIIDPSPGITIDAIQENPKMWIINMQGVEGTLYEGEQFQLKVKFGSKYPFKPPKVKFVGQSIPVHPCVYSNGHIRLSILADDWSPALTIQSVCLSIQSMLSRCKCKKKPGLADFFKRMTNFNSNNASKD